jgi:hypothetical protein
VAAGPVHLGTQQGGLARIGPWLPRGCRLQLLASRLLALASRSEPRLRERWGKRTGEPSAAGHGGGPRQWVPGSAQSFEGPRGQYRGPRPERDRQGGPAQPGPSESCQTRPRAAADQVDHRAAFEPAIFPGNGRPEVLSASRRGASQAARLKVTPVMLRTPRHADAREGPGRDSETLSGWAGIPRCVPTREIGTRD